MTRVIFSLVMTVIVRERLDRQAWLPLSGSFSATLAVQVNNIRSNVLQEQTHIAATEPVQTTLFTLGILAEALNNANVPFTAGEIKVYLQRIEALALSSQISLLTSDSRELNSKRKKKHFKTHDRIQILSHPEWTGNMSYHIRLFEGKLL